MFEKLVEFVQSHKSVIIRGSGILVGAVIGILIVGQLEPDATEEFPDMPVEESPETPID